MGNILFPITASLRPKKLIYRKSKGISFRQVDRGNDAARDDVGDRGDYERGY